MSGNSQNANLNCFSNRFDTSSTVKKLNYVFDPPLPNLWSNYNVASKQLKGTLQGKEAKKLYDQVIASFDINHPQKNMVPSRKYGKKNNNHVEVPLLSLGGMVALRSSLRKNTQLLFINIKCLKVSMSSQLYFLLNGVIVPIVLFLSVWLYYYYRYVSNVKNSEITFIIQKLCISIFVPILWLVLSGWLIVDAHQRHLSALFRYAHYVGIYHIETARGYNESESQIANVLKHQQQGGKKWVVQTKVKPYNIRNKFYKTSLNCIKALQNQVDFLTVHGINEKKHITMCNDYTIDEIQLLRNKTNVQMFGYSGHGEKDSVLHAMIKNDDGVFDYINLHYGFFTSYTNIDNQSTVLLANRKQMGKMK